MTPDFCWPTVTYRGEWIQDLHSRIQDRESVSLRLSSGTGRTCRLGGPKEGKQSLLNSTLPNNRQVRNVQANHATPTRKVHPTPISSLSHPRPSQYRPPPRAQRTPAHQPDVRSEERPHGRTVRLVCILTIKNVLRIPFVRHFVKEELPRIRWANPLLDIAVHRVPKTRQEKWAPHATVEFGESAFFFLSCHSVYGVLIGHRRHVYLIHRGWDDVDDRHVQQVVDDRRQGTHGPRGW